MVFLFFLAMKCEMRAMSQKLKAKSRELANILSYHLIA